MVASYLPFLSHFLDKLGIKGLFFGGLYNIGGFKQMPSP